MTSLSDPANRSYDAIYREFDSPLQREIRRDAYGEDIGQQSWVTADELRADVARLKLSAHSHLLDLGCGPGGPLTFLMMQAGCRGFGVEVNADALAIARAKAEAAGLTSSLELRHMDLNDPLTLPDAAFDAAVSYDVVVHLNERASVFAQVSRVLERGSRFLFTDAGVLTGSISSDEIQTRALYGPTQLTAPGFNERLLQDAGFRLLETQDRTASVLRNATGRRLARDARRERLTRIEGTANFDRQQSYLQCIEALSRGAGLSRVMYLAERV
jgi:cyclopropane fatty-acyl-phospholipid synthase-like methyltransferase